MSAADPTDTLELTPLFDGGGEPWLPLLKPVIEKQRDAGDFIGPGRDKGIVPVRELTFQALKPNPPGKWRVVIFGQNPYPRVESATGIAMFDNAFADWKEPQFGKVTSIRCIIKAACMNKLGIEKATSTAAIRSLLAKNDVVTPPQWFQAMLTQGVLLLNAALTASSDNAVSTSRHTSFWKPVVEAVVTEILRAKHEQKEGVVFAWWGAHAKLLRAMVDKIAPRFPDAVVRHVDHCNPAAQGDMFCNKDHFGEINAALSSLSMKPVDWLPVQGGDLGAGQDEHKRLGDFIESTRELHKLYLERLQGVGDEQLEELEAITGLATLSVPTLPAAVEPLLALFPGLKLFAKKAAERAPELLKAAAVPGLTADEVGALFLYTTESPLYRSLNAALRDKSRAKAEPWHGYLRLFLSAHDKLERRNESLWRGVHKDLRKEYPTGRTVTWWGVSSCTTKLAVAKGFLGQKGKRMLFEVKPRSAVSIRAFSAFTGEEELVLAPGTSFSVVDVAPGDDGLVHVKLEELEQERLIR